MEEAGALAGGLCCGRRGQRSYGRALCCKGSVRLNDPISVLKRERKRAPRELKGGETASSLPCAILGVHPPDLQPDVFFFPAQPVWQ